MGNSGTTPGILRTLVWAWDRGMAPCPVYDFLSPNKTNRDWRRGHEAMPQQIPQVHRHTAGAPEKGLPVRRRLPGGRNMIEHVFNRMKHYRKPPPATTGSTRPPSPTSGSFFLIAIHLKVTLISLFHRSNLILCKKKQSILRLTALCVGI